MEEGKVFCSPSLLDMRRDIAIGILAHEFAHVFRGHAGRTGLQEEYEADSLASQWGFGAETRAMRKCFGPVTDERKSGQI